MEDTNLIRNLVAAVYSGEEWKNKVANMDDYQVTAVYLSFIKRGLIGKTVEFEPKTGVDRLTEIKEGVPELDEILKERKNIQMDIYELLRREGFGYKPEYVGKRAFCLHVHNYKCTACGKIFETTEADPGNYCPHCGVKLK